MRLATNTAQNTAKIVSQNCVLLLTRGHSNRVQQKGLNLWYGRDSLVPAPSLHQPLLKPPALTKKMCKIPFCISALVLAIFNRRDVSYNSLPSQFAAKPIAN